MTAPIAGVVGDWIVQRNGTMKDLVTRQLATITGNGGVLPNTRPWGDVRAGGAGWCGDFTDAAVVTIPTAGWDTVAGTIVVVAGEPAAYGATNCMVEWALSPVLWLEKRSDKTPYAQGGSCISYRDYAAGANVCAMTWESAGFIGSYRDGVGGVVTAGAEALLSEAPTATIGSRTGSYPFNGPIQRVTIYPTALTAGEVAALNPMLQGTSNVNVGALMAAGVL